jgi:hypothetical protein
MMNDIIQSLWIGELTCIQKLSIASFLAHGHEFHLYTYKALAGVPFGCKVMDANAIIPEENIFTYKETYGAQNASVSMFSNLFRYKLLLERGGWWVDTDTVCLKPFRFKGDFIAAREDKEKIAAGIMKAKANHPLIRLLYDKAREYERDAPWGTTGPNLLTKVLKQNKFRFWYNSNILAPKHFYPIHWDQWHKLLEDTPIPKESSAVHFWFEMWRRARIDPDQIPPKSLYQKLAQRYLNIR